jgi:hypothetical protein
MSQQGKTGNRQAQLAKLGWKKQTTYDEPRLSELVAAYEEAGLEVRLEEPDPETAGDCNACFTGSPGSLKTIYTREKKAQGARRTQRTCGSSSPRRPAGRARRRKAQGTGN